MMKRAFYIILKEEIKGGQYMLEDMMLKINTAVAKEDYLTFDEADELKALAIASQDPNYKPARTQKQLDVEIQRNAMAILELFELLLPSEPVIDGGVA